MASQQVSAQLRYLNDSAHLLAASAPRTSAFLMSRCNSLMFESNLQQSESQRLQVCRACGNIMVLGMTASRRVCGTQLKLRGKEPQAKTSATQDEKVVLYDCELCERQTQQIFRYPGTKASRNLSSKSFGRLPVAIQKASSSMEFTSTSMASIASMNSSANISSKKRAKVRKQGGLQALVARKKEIDAGVSGGGFGLDLLDLMKSSSS